MCNFNVIIKTIKVLQGLSEFVFAMNANEENVIDVSILCQGLQLLGLQKRGFKFINKYTRVRRCKNL